MFKIGCFTFGGGWSIIAQIEEEFCKKRGWVTEEQILDFMSVAKSLPGIMIVNYSVLFGYTAAGIPGALAASFGLVSPAVIVIAVITNFYDIFCNNPYVIRMMNGVRSAVIPVIIGAAWKLKKNALTDRATYQMCIRDRWELLEVRDGIYRIRSCGQGIPLRQQRDSGAR